MNNKPCKGYLTDEMYNHDIVTDVTDLYWYDNNETVYAHESGYTDDYEDN